MSISGSCGITPPSSAYGALDIDGDGYFGASNVLYILSAIQQQEVSQKNNQNQQVQNSPIVPKQAFVQAVPLQQEQTSKHPMYQEKTGDKGRR